DELLDGTELKTLPLWLLGSERDTQRVVGALPITGEHASELALELARREVSERAYAAARDRLEPYVKGASGEVSLDVYAIYLYALGRTDMLGEAALHIARLDSSGRERADVQDFLSWYTTRFGLPSGGDLLATDSQR
ncbi:MAG TPA: hypothetical protein VIV14_03025, partial [Gammaproteobacteria bacterium]